MLAGICCELEMSQTILIRKSSITTNGRDAASISTIEEARSREGKQVSPVTFQAFASQPLAKPTASNDHTEIKSFTTVYQVALTTHIAFHQLYSKSCNQV